LALPNTDTHLTLAVLRYASGGKEPEAVLLDVETLRKIDNGDLLLVVHGKLTYEDIFGVSHWLRFCSFGSSNLRKRSSINCDEYNAADDNK